MLIVQTGAEGACRTCQTPDARGIIAACAHTMPAAAIHSFNLLLLGLQWQAACRAGTLGLPLEGL